VAAVQHTFRHKHYTEYTNETYITARILELAKVNITYQKYVTTIRAHNLQN
jgi:hypothetical protein